MTHSLSFESYLFELFFLFGIVGGGAGFFFIKSIIKPYSSDIEKLDNLLKEMIHELNIPVSTIVANSSMLKENESDLKKLRKIERIELAAKSLSREYENLEYAIRSQIKQPKIEEFDLRELVLESISLFDNKRVKISTNLDTFNIKGERLGYLKMLKNLIDNAIKYSNDGGDVKIYLAKDILRIKDSGLGISEEKILRVFDRYFQANEGSSGFGIGLSFVKDFCDDNGIDIRINSKIGEGSEFVLFFKAQK